MTDQNGQLLNLPIDHLQPNPLQPRGVITNDSLTELVESVKEHGILEPLVAAQTPAGYQIIAGERRWRSAKLAGLETVPVVVRKTTPKGMLEMAIVENVQRKDLNPIDRGKAFERLINEFGYTNAEIAKKISKSPAYISNSIKLLDLPDALTDGVLNGKISEGHARALAGIDDTSAMIEAYKKILSENGSVRRAEELARRYKSEQENQSLTHKAQKNIIILNERLDTIQKDLTESLGEKATVKVKQSRVQAKIDFVFKGSPMETNKKIEALHKALQDVKFED